MFDRIAPRYDLLNRLLSAGTDSRWRRACVDRLELAAPARILDVCTGTADLLIEALRRDPRHSGVGIDLSQQMLVRSQAKLLRRGLQGRSGLASGDAERLPLAPSSFDAVVVGFGIRNVGDMPVALRELRRVLRRGGRLVVLEFSLPRGLLGSVYRLYFDRILPRVGAAISGDPAAYAYLPASVARFPDPAGLAAELVAAGFENVRFYRLTGGIAYLHCGDRP
jgi:demethylmenaquinone methyltransferase/2-methoxy-6-polyprenyl-1,4-benzoquinol methylase